jgi:phosphoribosylformylglycinamidine synthase
MTRSPCALILQAYGTNRDQDAAEALRLAGASPELVPLALLRQGRGQFSAFDILVLPGGFSYADALGAGRLLALDLKTYFSDQIQAFVAAGKPVIGICNGFQALVKSGLLPAVDEAASPRPAPAATLTFNAGGHFECRWVTLQPVSQRCLWTRGLAEPVECPVAHGEGNFQVAGATVLAALQAQDQIALTYIRTDGTPAHGEYPSNPNGSLLDIAGICNPAGNVLGLMPHPENHIRPWQHPRGTRAGMGRNGLGIFQNAVRYMKGF